MFRVAAVAKLICDSLNEPVNTKTIVSACLLHDMGNLIKTKFETAPELFEPEGVEYWTEKQNQMKEKYGTDVHKATLAILKDASVSKEIQEIIDEASFEDIERVASTGSFEAKTLEYADMRVGMHGVISLRERFEDIKARYSPHRFSAERLDSMQKAAERMETEIFSGATIKPTDVTDGSTARLQVELKSWQVN